MRRSVFAIEIIVLTALILATRCANYRDVFVGGNIYFTDADCYARMTRVRLCAEHPGLVIRQHEFENYPTGTTPHTTAPLDYLILGVSVLLKPLTSQSVDLAGALISPLLGLIGGWFLWWWTQRMGFRYRWASLILYAISPIVVHGTELGRPDHQSLLLLLIVVSVCAEWSCRTERIRAWIIASAAAWALAIWVSAYEPLLLLFLLLFLDLLRDRAFFAKERRTGWILFAVAIAIALLVERRLPSLSISSTELFRNWSRTIGELRSISLLNPVWFRWTGYLVVFVPVLLVLRMIKSKSKSKNVEELPLFVVVLLIATFGLTIWQARWSYFFVMIFTIALPLLLEPIEPRFAVWFAFGLSLLPLLQDWDERVWPNESELARLAEKRLESVQLRSLASAIRSSDTHPFLAPWWLSPEIAYWSGQPGVAGSSHESLDGIRDSARFFMTEDWLEADDILRQRKVDWVFGYDSDRVTLNSAEILGLKQFPTHPLDQVIDRRPTQAPNFLVFAGQNPAAKLFRVVNKR
jgi:hypothetical protein